ncbi:MAG TPA: response regulator [Pirellulales bacterium]|jgi:DNA-binding response OmpR family regulator|nr:response regulator [Pirellulales bacterium]
MAQRILLCDDEIHILKAAEIKLSRSGFEVTTARDGLEAWESIQQQAPDIVITDCQMPRLDGLGLIQRIRENPATRELPILMLSAKGFELAEADLAQRWNVLAILAKPFSPRELVLIVEKALAHGGVSA